ncbi:unnamed protein product [Spirodela intermedia]|uniref:Uncharacterized protein n=1 Tax=Spirodela intermedia TaxID=51605 RepID=A0A7I8K6A2_SPIIN|nr:unnamed protein product [Spirodela intermedia]
MKPKAKSSLLLTLGFVFLFLGATLASRRLPLSTHALDHERHDQDEETPEIADLNVAGEEPLAEETFEMHRRMDLQNLQDYGGSNANDHHNPEPPGTP